MRFIVCRLLILALLAVFSGCSALPGAVPGQTPGAPTVVPASEVVPTVPGGTLEATEPARPATPGQVLEATETAIPAEPASTPPAQDSAAPSVTPALVERDRSPSGDAAWPQPGRPIDLATLADLQPLRPLGFGKAVHAAIAPDNSLLAVATTAGVAIFALPDFAVRRFDPILAGAHKVEFSADGAQLQVTTGSYFKPVEVELRRVGDGVVVERKPAEFEMKPVSYTSPSGAFSAALHPADSAPTPHVVVRRVVDDTTIYEDELTEQVAFSVDSSLVALVAYDGTVRVVTLSSGEARELPLPSTWSAVFTSDGHSLMLGGRGVRRLNLADGSVEQLGQPAMANDPGLLSAAQRASLSADGSVLTIEGRYTIFESTARRASAWRVDQPQLAPLWDVDAWGIGHDNYRTYVAAVSPAAQLAAWTNDGHVLELHVGETQVLTRSVHAGVSALAFSPDGALLAVGDAQGQIQLLSADAGLQLAQSLATEDAPTELAFSPDGGLLAARGSSGRTLVWDLARGREVATIAEHPPTPSLVGPQLLITADQQLLIAWDQSGVRFYRLDDGTLVHALGAPAAGVAVDPQRRWLAILQNEQVTLWGVL